MPLQVCCQPGETCAGQWRDSPSGETAPLQEAGVIRGSAAYILRSGMSKMCGSTGHCL